MPEFTDRLTHESELQAVLARLFREQRRRVEGPGPHGWDEWQRELEAAIAPHLAATFDVAHVKLADQLGILLPAKVTEAVGTTTVTGMAAADSAWIVEQGPLRAAAAAFSWAMNWAHTLGSLIVDTVRTQVDRARGIAADLARSRAARDPDADEAALAVLLLFDQYDTIFSSARSEVISATETTRAISAGELVARQVFDRQEDLRAAGIPVTPPTALPVQPTALPIRPGEPIQPTAPPPRRTIAVWYTEQDAKVCPICRPLDRRPEYVWADRFPLGPPAHVNCLSGDSLITASCRITAICERPYEGDLVVFETAREHKLSVTLNHPILTSHGWVAAGQLQVGEEVISHRFNKRCPSVVVGDEIGMPTTLEEMAYRFSLSNSTASRGMPLTSEDFHGDAAYGQIAIVWADSFLWNKHNVPFREPVCKHGLKRRVESAPMFSPSTAVELFTERDLAIATSGISRSDLPSALRDGHVRPFEPLGRGLVSGRDTGYEQSSPYGEPAYASLKSDPILGHAIEVFFDDVISIEKKSVRTHVYNLQTESGMFAANGIITHNCRCWLEYEVAERAVGLARPLGGAA